MGDNSTETKAPSLVSLCGTGSDQAAALSILFCYRQTLTDEPQELLIFFDTRIHAMAHVYPATHLQEES